MGHRGLDLAGSVEGVTEGNNCDLIAFWMVVGDCKLIGLSRTSFVVRDSTVKKMC